VVLLGANARVEAHRTEQSSRRWRRFPRIPAHIPQVIERSARHDANAAAYSTVLCAAVGSTLPLSFDGFHLGASLNYSSHGQDFERPIAASTRKFSSVTFRGLYDGTAVGTFHVDLRDTLRVDHLYFNLLNVRHCFAGCCNAPDRK